MLIDGRRYTLVRAEEPAVGSRPTISPREREIVRLVARGLPNKVIAARLRIALRTVEIHRARVMEKMGARHLSELVRMVIRLQGDD